jgi:threonine/homoserine/homoserine lactone efflux protein
MLPDHAVLLPFSVAVVVIALTPGPDMAFFLGRALTQGRAAGLAALAGATSGLLVHTMLVALGLSALIVAAPTLFLALKLAGALYLAWLAVQAIRHGSALALPDRPPAPRASPPLGPPASRSTC